MSYKPIKLTVISPILKIILLTQFFLVTIIHFSFLANTIPPKERSILTVSPPLIFPLSPPQSGLPLTLPLKCLSSKSPVSSISAKASGHFSVPPHLTLSRVCQLITCPPDSLHSLGLQATTLSWLPLGFTSLPLRIFCWFFLISLISSCFSTCIPFLADLFHTWL